MVNRTLKRVLLGACILLVGGSSWGVGRCSGFGQVRAQGRQEGMLEMREAVGTRLYNQAASSENEEEVRLYEREAEYLWERSPEDYIKANRTPTKESLKYHLPN